MGSNSRIGAVRQADFVDTGQLLYCLMGNNAVEMETIQARRGGEQAILEQIPVMERFPFGLWEFK